ncbi:hypothetical protein VP01_2362g4 [Puccinia sorghi]|uniref:Uncharacterized protein n=1 Tax=Puccinia sorghi TaxID=27349 RepID=A0A0L6V738_9BASI|nr:hypothetical protein VP01_2362g4 [Puccinia sorghi]
MSHEKRLILLADTPAQENIVPLPVSSDGSTTPADPKPSSQAPPLSANDLPLSPMGFIAQLEDIQLIPRATLSAPPGPLEYFPPLRLHSPIRTPIELRYQPLNTRRDPLGSSPVFPQPLLLGEIANHTSDYASEIDELDLIILGRSSS